MSTVPLRPVPDAPAASPPTQLRLVPDGEPPRAPPERGPPPDLVEIACDACGQRRAPWSCTRVSGTRCRGERVAAHIAGIVPRVPVRHWWLSLPVLGAAAARAGPKLAAALVRAFVGAVFGAYRRSVPIEPGQRMRCGAVSVVTRLTPRLAPELRVHALVLDGVYRGDEASFVVAPGAPPLQRVAWGLARRLHGVDGWSSLPGRVGQALAEGPPLGPVRRVFGADRASGSRRRYTAAAADDVLVRASEPIGARDRGAMIELARYLARPVTDPHRFSPRPDRWVRYTLPRPLADGTRYVELSADALASRLARLAGPTGPRVRYHGILATGQDARTRVLPEQLALVEGTECTLAPTPPGRLPPYLLHARGRGGSTASRSSVEGAK